MSAENTQKRRKILPDAKSVERYAKLTNEGVFNLSSAELAWQARYDYLKERGYLLRPRYSPDWKPSWLNTNNDPIFCEDSVMLLHYQVIDATRLSDNSLVAIKAFSKQSQELHIARFFVSMQDSRNHCVPVLEILSDPADPELRLMVMPYLRPCNNPDFATVGDIVDFVDQTIDGLAFMHMHNVAHRDVAVENIMMDARALYPTGHHPIRLGYTPDMQGHVSALPRAGRDIKYFYVDFGLSVRFPEGSSTLVIGDVGRDEEVPELSDSVPYDAFKVDIFALGNLYAKEFEQKYKGTEFLVPLIEPMTRRQPELRPTAEQVLQQWKKERAKINDTLFRWRLAPKNEPPLERVVNDTVAVAWEGMYRLKKFVKP
ncbi:kinase-like domain-containing protein [Trametes polyzona]|nr:kinase-like domain-containing protein [Trametes polyzona]